MFTEFIQNSLNMAKAIAAGERAEAKKKSGKKLR